MFGSRIKWYTRFHLKMWMITKVPKMVYSLFCDMFFAQRKIWFSCSCHLNNSNVLNVARQSARVQTSLIFIFRWPTRAHTEWAQVYLTASVSFLFPFLAAVIFIFFHFLVSIFSLLVCVFLVFKRQRETASAITSHTLCEQPHSAILLHKRRQRWGQRCQRRRR